MKHLRKFKHFENVQDVYEEIFGLQDVREYVKQCDDAEICTKYLQEYKKKNGVRNRKEWDDIILIWYDKFKDELDDIRHLSKDDN